MPLTNVRGFGRDADQLGVLLEVVERELLDLRVVAGAFELLDDVVDGLPVAGKPGARLPPFASAISWSASRWSRTPSGVTALVSFLTVLLFGTRTPGPRQRLR